MNGMEWILDVAHNRRAHGRCARACVDILEAHSPRILVFSCLRDKPLARDGADSLSAVRRGDCCSDPYGARRGAGRSAGGGEGNGNAGGGGRIGARGAARWRRSARQAAWRWFRDRCTWWARRARAAWRERWKRYEPAAQPDAAVLSLADERAAGAGCCCW